MAAKTAVDASRTNAWNVEPERLVLVTDLAHPMYDQRVHLPLDESLVLNVMHHGVIEPVIICKDGADLVVVDGRQRVKAAREANRRLLAEGKLAMFVTCMVRKGDDASLFGVMVSTNELRREDTPLGRAEKLQRFLAMGRSESEAAVVFGVTRQTIANWKALLDLAPEVKQAVENGVIGATAAAQEFAGLSRQDQRAKLMALNSDPSPNIGKRPAISGTKAKATLAGTTPALRMRSRKEIQACLNDLPAGWNADMAKALCWVLGEEV